MRFVPPLSLVATSVVAFTLSFARAACADDLPRGAHRDDDGRGRFAAGPGAPDDADRWRVLAPEDRAHETPVRRPTTPPGDVRLQLGPAAITTGDGIGVGLAGALDLGRRAVGVRFAGAWARGGAPDTGFQSFAVTSAELTVDASGPGLAGGRLHPVIGLGGGLAFVERGRGVASSGASGAMGVGVAHAALDWDLAVRDADIRAGLDLTGALAGPAEREVRDVRGFAMLGAHLVFGF